MLQTRRLLVPLLLFLLFFSSLSNVNGSNIYKELLKTRDLINANPGEALKIIDSLKLLPEVNENQNLKIQIYDLESRAALILKDYNKAYNSLKEMDSLLYATSEMSRIASNYNRWGMLLTKMGVYEKAMEYLLKAYKIRHNLEESETLICSQNALAALYYEINEGNMAKAAIQKAVRQINNSNDVFLKAMILDNAGQIEEKFGQKDSALLYYHKAIEIEQISNNKIGHIQTYQNLAGLYIKMNMLDSAFHYAMSALDLANKINAQQDIVSLKLTLTKILINQSQFDNAEMMLLTVYPEIESSLDLKIKKRAYNLFTAIYENKNDLKKALQFAKKTIFTTDSLITEDKEDKISQLTSIYNTGEKELEIEFYQKMLITKTQKNNIRHIITAVTLILLILILSIIIFRLYKRYKNQKLQLSSELEDKKRLEQEYQSLEQRHTLMSTSYGRILEKEQETNSILKTKAESIDLLKHNMHESIQTITTFSSNILLESNIDDKQKMYLEKIHTSGKALERILSKMIKSSGDIISSAYDFDICDIDIIAAETTKFAKGKQIENDFLEIVFSFPQISSSVKLYSNQKAIIRALEFLIENAFTYKKQGIIKIGYKVVDEQIRFYVDDSRINVPISTQTAIYQWQNVGLTDQSQLNDENLSPLFHTCQIVQSINSHLNFETSNTWGNMFYFILPLRYDEITKQKNEQVFPSWNDKHILIADDEFLNFEILRNYIKPTNARVSHARNGQEILEMIKIFKFDLIIMDIKMPRMDGIDTMYELKKLSNKVPVIAQSSYASASERTSFMQMGFAEFMLKPIDKTELYQVVDKLFMLTS
ncbi:MAG TPA: response regulator [Salinivirgaceae bacterium]|nr:response regulator [Salinivirgaceae bacterium]HQA75917.1 response regulator [Salinivirgaceae bacterium]